MKKDPLAELYRQKAALQEHINLLIKKTDEVNKGTPDTGNWVNRLNSSKEEMGQIDWAIQMFLTNLNQNVSGKEYEELLKRLEESEK